MKVTQSCPTLCYPMDYSLWNSPGQNTGVGSLSLLQGIFPTQGSTQVSHIAGGFFTHCSILYQLSYQGNPEYGKRSVNICSMNALSCWMSLSGLISKAHHPVRSQRPLPTAPCHLPSCSPPLPICQQMCFRAPSASLFPEGAKHPLMM